jgi:hypothetical protein
MTENPKEWQWRYYNALDDFARELDKAAEMRVEDLQGSDGRDLPPKYGEDRRNMTALRQVLINFGAADIGEYKDTGE